MKRGDVVDILKALKVNWTAPEITDGCVPLDMAAEMKYYIQLGCGACVRAERAWVSFSDSTFYDILQYKDGSISGYIKISAIEAISAGL